MAFLRQSQKIDSCDLFWPLHLLVGLERQTRVYLFSLCYANHKPIKMVGGHTRDGAVENFSRIMLLAQPKRI